MRKPFGTAAIAALLLAISPAANATITSIGSRAAFNATYANRTLVDFEGIAPAASFVPFFPPSGLTLSGVNFIFTAPFPGSTNYAVLVASKNVYPPPNPPYPSDYLVNETGGNSGPGTQHALIIKFPATTAIGFDVGTFYGAGLSFVLSNGDTTSTATSNPFSTLGFVGFSSSTQFTSLTIITVGTDPIVLDNFAVTPDDSGFVPPDANTKKCEDLVALHLKKLAACMTKCHVKQAAAAFKGKVFDEEACEEGTQKKPVSCRAAFDKATTKLLGRTPAICPPCLDATAQRKLADSVVTLIDNNKSLNYCAGTTPLP